MLRKSISVLLSCMLVLSVILLPVLAEPVILPSEYGKIHVVLESADRIYTADDFPGVDIEKIIQWDRFMEIYITDKTKDGTDAAMEIIRDVVEEDGYTDIIQDYLLIYEVDYNPGAIIGDVNEDGTINITDAALVMKYIAGWDLDLSKTVADFNSDGIVNLTDVSLILKNIAKWDV